MSQNNQSEQPSLIGGHVEYVKGAAEVRTPWFLLRIFHNKYWHEHNPVHNWQRHGVSRMAELRRAGQGPRHRRHEGRRRGPRCVATRIRQGRGDCRQGHGLRGYAEGGSCQQEARIRLYVHSSWTWMCYEFLRFMVSWDIIIATWLHPFFLFMNDNLDWLQYWIISLFWSIPAHDLNV